jgi:hypothetical protein
MSEGGNHDGHLCLREEIMMSPMSEEEIMMVTYVGGGNHDVTYV